MADFDDPVVDILPGRREKRRHSHSGVRRNHRKEDDFAKNVNFGHQFVALVSIQLRHFSRKTGLYI